MAEYLERKAAIKAIYESDPNGIRRTLGFNVGQIEEALRAVPAVSVPQWISVKDRLPDDNDRVIAFRPYEAEVSAYRYCVKWGWSLKTSMSYNGITHWMPLPEPPKGGTENE